MENVFKLLYCYQKVSQKFLDEPWREFDRYAFLEDRLMADKASAITINLGYM